MEACAKGYYYCKKQFDKWNQLLFDILYASYLLQGYTYCRTSAWVMNPEALLIRQH